MVANFECKKKMFFLLKMLKENINYYNSFKLPVNRHFKTSFLWVNNLKKDFITLYKYLNAFKNMH